MKEPESPRQFMTTHWSLVQAATADEAGQTHARQALEKLCLTYWYPLYAFVRSRGYSAMDAQDLTQAFFARLVEKKDFASANKERGRFRSYLLGAMKHFLNNEWQKSKTQKRGGHLHIVQWDDLQPESRYTQAPDMHEDPETNFDREWALEVIANSLKALRREMEKTGKAEQFEVLKDCLTGENETPQEELARQLNISVGAVKVAIHRLRNRYRLLLRAAIAETVSSQKELDDELHHLISVLRQ